MAYIKQTWTNTGTSAGLGQTDQANAERLGYMENGIEEAHAAVDSIKSGEDETLSLGLLPPGSRLYVVKSDTVYGAANEWPATRPTSRTDVYVTWEGDTDPGSVALDNDHWDVR